jgi:hypothetical protein
MRIQTLITSCFILFFSGKLVAQENLPVTRIGIFVSLHLDSTFSDDTTYNFKEQMPKHILSGLDFSEGAMIGLDSISAAFPIEVSFFDIKSQNQNIQKLIQGKIFDSLQLIIGAVTGSDYKQLADIALSSQIPFLSSTMPNDGGISQNPFTILLNPTIAVHCQGIYKFIAQTFPKGNIIYIKKKGVQEDKIFNYLQTINQSNPIRNRINWQTYTMNDSLNTNDISKMIDTTRQNILICGSLEEKFNVNFLNMASNLTSSNIHFVGMPVWETLKELQNPKHKRKTIYYSTSFFNDGSEKFNIFNQKFLSKTNGKPSDIAYKAYDICFNFIHLLIEYNKDFMNRLNDASFNQFIDYNIQPVKNTSLVKPDYFENKRVYIIKRSNGTQTKAGNF